MKMTKVLKLSFNGDQISRNLVWVNPGELSTQPKNAGAIELQEGDPFYVQLILTQVNEVSDLQFTVNHAKLFTVLNEAAGDSPALSPFEAPGVESPWTDLTFSQPFKAEDGHYVLNSDAVTVKRPANPNIRWELNLALVAHITFGQRQIVKVLRFDPEVVVTQR